MAKLIFQIMDTYSLAIFNGRAGHKNNLPKSLSVFIKLLVLANKRSLYSNLNRRLFKLLKKRHGGGKMPVSHINHLDNSFIMVSQVLLSYSLRPSLSSINDLSALEERI
jgi:hypothetical protein